MLPRYDPFFIRATPQGGGRIQRWCEAHGVRYIVGIAKNARLHRKAEALLERCGVGLPQATGEQQRLFGSVRYGPTRGTGSDGVIVKAEHTALGSHQWHSFSGFGHSVKDSILGLGYPLIFYSVSGLPLPVLPFFAATFRPVFGITAHRTGPDGAVADTGRSRRPYEPRFP